jgi:hypothetical protein
MCLFEPILAYPEPGYLRPQGKTEELPAHELAAVYGGFQGLCHLRHPVVAQLVERGYGRRVGIIGQPDILELYEVGRFSLGHGLVEALLEGRALAEPTVEKQVTAGVPLVPVVYSSFKDFQRVRLISQQLKMGLFYDPLAITRDEGPYARPAVDDPLLDEGRERLAYGRAAHLIAFTELLLRGQPVTRL